MDIKKVQLIKPDEDQKAMGATGGFLVTTDEDAMTTYVPDDPGNRHYQEIAEWYRKKKIKPFRYKFIKPE